MILKVFEFWILWLVILLVFLIIVLGNEDFCWWFKCFFKFDFNIGIVFIVCKLYLKFCFVGDVVGELNLCGFWKVKFCGFFEFLFKGVFCLFFFEVFKLNFFSLFVVVWKLERDFLLLLFEMFLFFDFIVVMFDLVNFFFLKVFENFFNGEGICLFLDKVCVNKVWFCKLFEDEVFKRWFCKVVYDSGWVVLLSLGFL